MARAMAMAQAKSSYVELGSNFRTRGLSLMLLRDHVAKWVVVPSVMRHVRPQITTKNFEK